MRFRRILIIAFILCAPLASAQQTVRLGAQSSGKSFDGIGVVNGGGATAVLLKDYPEPQRSQIMDLVYKPMFGGSVSSLLVEVPGDGNSTQGSMPSHSHYRGDCNFQRGYIWWVLREAKNRNPDLPLDATAWSGPGWVGGWWTPEMVDFYISWMQGLRSVYGLELDAIGCHNEKGWNADFAKMLRKAMNERGFANVRLHGFDNWGQHKMAHIREMQKDPELRDAIDVISAHTFSEIPLSEEDRAIVESLGKPVWNSEEHVYLKGFDGLITIVKCFNENYIVSGATKIINWYDIAGVYPMQPYSVDPATVLAHQPWSGHYEIRESLWGYAHYGQFSRVGWRYVDDGCTLLDGGGSMVTLRDPATGDYSIIIETKDAEAPRKLTVRLDRSYGKKPLCVWYSDEKEQFVRKADITPRGGRFTLTLLPGAVYSLSTTRGQQKGGFDAVPAAEPFPIPYQEDFEEYVHPEEWGYLPHYTADLIGAFELAERPDRNGRCLRQVVGDQTHSWAPKWHHYTILGDQDWEDYEGRGRCHGTDLPCRHRIRDLGQRLLSESGRPGQVYPYHVLRQGQQEGTDRRCGTAGADQGPERLRRRRGIPAGQCESRFLRPLPLAYAEDPFRRERYHGLCRREACREDRVQSLSARDGRSDRPGTGKGRLHSLFRQPQDYAAREDESRPDRAEAGCETVVSPIGDS